MSLYSFVREFRFEQAPAHTRELMQTCLLDILGVLGNGTRIFVREPSFVEPFTRLPLAILPTFVVPIVIVSHVLLFSWARGGRR